MMGAGLNFMASSTCIFIVALFSFLGLDRVLLFLSVVEITSIAVDKQRTMAWGGKIKSSKKKVKDKPKFSRCWPRSTEEDPKLLRITKLHLVGSDNTPVKVTSEPIVSTSAPHTFELCYSYRFPATLWLGKEIRFGEKVSSSFSGYWGKSVVSVEK